MYLNIHLFFGIFWAVSLINQQICNEFWVCLYLPPCLQEMFLVDSKRRNTVILTASTYTSSRNVFHDTTNNGINYGSIIARKKRTINRLCNLEAIPNTRSHNINMCKVQRMSILLYQYIIISTMPNLQNLHYPTLSINWIL